MADEEQPKKRKIDLKSRLSSVRAAGTMAGPTASQPEAPEGSGDPLAFPPPPATGSVPPPAVLGSVPGGIAPPPGFSQEAPPEEESKPSAQQQTIKVEMGEEVLAERRKARKKTILFVAITAVVVGAAMFFLGILKERGDQGRKAVAGASTLSTEVEKSNVVLVDFSDLLRAGVDELGGGAFPVELPEKLKSTHVPFSADQLDGKTISGLPGTVLRDLLSYASGVKTLNEKKDRLQGMLGTMQKKWDAWKAEQKKPLMHFSVVFVQDQKKGVWTELVKNAKPWEEKGDWPAEYKVNRLQGKKAKEVAVKRYDRKKHKDKLAGGEDTIAMPIDRNTLGGRAPWRVMASEGYSTQKDFVEMKVTLSGVKEMIEGRQSPIPDQQTEGLLEQGKRLAEELKKLASK